MFSAPTAPFSISMCLMVKQNCSEKSLKTFRLKAKRFPWTVVMLLFIRSMMNKKRGKLKVHVKAQVRSSQRHETLEVLYSEWRSFQTIYSGGLELVGLLAVFREGRRLVVL